MKISSLILLATLAFLVVAMLITNVALKKEYDKIDKSDLYWTYATILNQPFKHLKIEGGNISNLAYEQNKKPSVRIFKNWRGFENNTVKAVVKNDTLFIKFPNTYDNVNEQRYMKFITPVRIFSPELLSVDGLNTNVGLFKMKQKSMSINISGRSKVQVESYDHHFDSLHISQRDSSMVSFEMSPDLMGTNAGITQTTDTLIRTNVHTGINVLTPSNLPVAQRIGSWEAMTVKAMDANVQGVSLLDVGHFQINLLKLSISDTSGIILSGGSLRRLKR